MEKWEHEGKQLSLSRCISFIVKSLQVLLTKEQFRNIYMLRRAARRSCGETQTQLRRQMGHLLVELNMEIYLLAIFRPKFVGDHIYGGKYTLLGFKIAKSGYICNN